ncbi:MAG: hypothetical protein ABIN10_10605 [Specibacter sp.]
MTAVFVAWMAFRDIWPKANMPRSGKDRAPRRGRKTVPGANHCLQRLDPLQQPVAWNRGIEWILHNRIADGSQQEHQPKRTVSVERVPGNLLHTNGVFPHPPDADNRHDQ